MTTRDPKEDFEFVQANRFKDSRVKLMVEYWIARAQAAESRAAFLEEENDMRRAAVQELSAQLEHAAHLNKQLLDYIAPEPDCCCNGCSEAAALSENCDASK